MHAVYVTDPGSSEETRRWGESMLEDATASLEDVTVETALVEHDDVVTALVDASREHDLTIIGATREGVIQKLLFGTIPETVAERSPTTVIMTKRHLDIRSRLQQSFRKLVGRVRGNGSPLEERD